jgi:hypothetical protein
MFKPHTQMFIPQMKNIKAQAKMLKLQVKNDYTTSKIHWIIMF